MCFFHFLFRCLIHYLPLIIIIRICILCNKVFLLLIFFLSDISYLHRVSGHQVLMDNRSRQAGSSSNLVYWASSFPRQPARVLVVEALPPAWTDTCAVICDAMDNFLSLACNVEGPCRIPLLSLYAISRQQECLLPFVVRSKKEENKQKKASHPPHSSHPQIRPINLGLSNVKVRNFFGFVYRKFEVTWPGCSPVWTSWGLFQVKAASEEYPEQGSCYNRPCWTVCSSSSSTLGTLVRAAKPGATCLWRWDGVDWTGMSPQGLGFFGAGN